MLSLSLQQWDGGSNCYSKITIDYQGKSTGAMITDEVRLTFFVRHLRPLHRH